MHDPGSRLYDRHLGIVADESDEALATAGDAEVDVAHSLEHGARSLVGEGQQLYGTRIHTMCFQHIFYQFYSCLTRLLSVLAAFEHAGVAALETEGEYIEGDVRACLINHAYHAEGDADAAQVQAVGERLVLEGAP